MINNIKKKHQFNYSILYDTKFVDKFYLFSESKDPLSLVTVSLLGGKKDRSTVIYGLPCLWDSRATVSMIKSQHTKPYESKMHYNKVEHSTSAGPYCTAHEVKKPFCTLYFSSSKIILHQFHVNKNEGES